MKTLQQQRLEFLQDTVNYYSEDTNRRAVCKGVCVYYDEITGNKCAIGRHINPASSQYNLAKNVYKLAATVVKAGTNILN